MSRVDNEQGLMPSLLDRLIDPNSGGTSWRRGYGIEQMMEAVRRDLEELLNTRQSLAGIPPGFVETEKSVIGYGLPDLTSLNAVTTQQREDLGRVIELVVSRFEPRLKDVRAVLTDPGSGKERTVRFHIEAKMCVDPAPEVAFDTILELTTGHYTIQPST
jgi:type VI secretion system protein ImpF